MDSARTTPHPYLRVRQATDVEAKGLITEWLKNDGEARARFHTRLKYLSKILRAELNKKQFRYLGDRIWEIKWEAGKKQWRALGFDYDGWFVMVLGCTHKDQVYDPPNCLATAKKRRDETVSGERMIINYDIP